MDKVKNILKPGAGHDDEVLYGSGQSSDPVHSGNTTTAQGEGSHFGNSRTTGSDTNPLSSSTNPSSTTATSGLGSSTTGTGSHNPLSSSTNPTSTTSGTTSGLGSSTLGSTDNSSRMAPSDTSSTTAIKSGIPGNTHTGTGLTGSSDTDKALPSQPGSTTGTSGLSGSTLPDRSVGNTTSDSRSFPLGGTTGTTGSSGLGSNTTGLGSSTDTTTGTPYQSNVGRDAALGGAALGGADLAEHHHGTTGSGLGTNTSRTTGTESGIGGFGPEAWERNPQHEHTFKGESQGPAGHHATRTAELLDPVHGHGNVVHGLAVAPELAGSSAGSGLGSTTRSTESTTGTGIGSTTGSGLGSSTHGTESTTGTGIGSTTGSGLGSSTEGHHHGARDAAIAGGVGSGGTGAPHHHDSSSTGAPDYTHEQPRHSSKILNKLDPRSDTIPIEESRGVDKHSTTTSGTSGSTHDHHHGKEAAGAGALAGAGYEAEKHHHKMDDTAAPSSSAAYGSQVGFGSHESRDAGVASYGGVNDPLNRSAGPTTSTGQHHTGRDVAGGAAVAGAGYEAGKHHHGHEPSSTIGGTPYEQQAADPSRTTTDKHHLGRDTSAVGGTGLAATEDEKHRHGHHDPTSTTGTTTSPTQPSTLDRDTTDKHHTGRDAALGAGAAGGAAYAGHEYSKKEAEKEAHDRAKAEAKHEKELEKEHKHHDKAAVKEEKHEEKKHGGILGLFKHDKTKDEPKKEELEHDRHGKSHHGAETAAVGAGTVGAAGVAEHEHDRNRLHKDPPASLTQDTHRGSSITDEVTGLPIDLSKGQHTGMGTDDIPHGERHTATGDQLTSGGKYHDPAGMGYGAATLPGTDVPGSKHDTTTGTHGTTTTGTHGTTTTGTHGTTGTTGTTSADPGAATTTMREDGTEVTEGGHEVLSKGPEKHSILKGF